MITLDEFLALPTEEVARLVRAAGPQVCVFPINGTRRWFMLEHARNIKSDPVEAYLDIAGRRQIELYKLLFDHGLDVLLTPVFGSELLTRGEAYLQKIGAEGLRRLAAHPDFIYFYEKHQVSVHFYGEYRENLISTPYAYLSDLFSEITNRTKIYNSYRLFYGVFANDATEAIAKLAVQYYQEYNEIPNRRVLVTKYYGEYIDPANLFIGFDKFSVFDYPLLSLGTEDLYFTVSPSPYMAKRQLRVILYDHLYSRHVEEPDYTSMSIEEQNVMSTFYNKYREETLGVGTLRGGIWYPFHHLEHNIA